jgi:hypothetical protein
MAKKLLKLPVVIVDDRSLIERQLLSRGPRVHETKSRHAVERDG